MAEAGRVRVEIGFEGGQVISGFVDASHADQLERALQDGSPGVVTLESEDGAYSVVVNRVSYFRRSSRASRVGFAAG